MKLFNENYMGHAFIHNKIYHPSHMNNNYDWKCSICGCLCLFAKTNMNDVYYLREGYMHLLNGNKINNNCVINFTCNEYIIKKLLE